MQNKSCLSVGELIFKILGGAEKLQRLTKIYPLVADEAELPYIVYQRTGLDQDPVKSRNGVDAVYMQIAIFTANYTEGVELAESVREVLDHTQIDGSFGWRICVLHDAEELWENDAFCQKLMFKIKL